MDPLLCDNNSLVIKFVDNTYFPYLYNCFKHYNTKTHKLINNYNYT